jgi:NADH dehydrogenase FAD-containing subunit
VERIEIGARRLICADGTEFTYDAALIATGDVPRRAKLPGIGLGNVFLLRNRADAEAIVAQAERSERAVVLGTSFIGMEVAASLRERGLDVTVVGNDDVPFSSRLGARIGAAFTVLHERRGVKFRLSCEIAALEGDPDVRCVMLRNDERLAADLVVVGSGVAPATSGIVGWPLTTMAASELMRICTWPTDCMPAVTSRAFPIAVTAIRSAWSIGMWLNSMGGLRRSIWRGTPYPMTPCPCSGRSST